MKTVLITGASSGIGLATAQYFAAKGWNVAATMRHPEGHKDLQMNENVKVYQLDVNDEESIRKAIEATIRDFGGIDAVVNNAGYGAIGLFEAATPAQIEEQFRTNVFGTMNVIRAILPYFRQKRNGHIINISSMGGRITFPIYSVYHGTKWALEGFSESLQFELRPFNIKVKLIEPGAIKTDFYGRSQIFFGKTGIESYDEYVARTHKNSQNVGKSAPGPEVVAKTIFRAATDDGYKLRYPSSFASHAFLFLRRILPVALFNYIVRKVVEKR